MFVNFPFMSDLLCICTNKFCL